MKNKFMKIMTLILTFMLIVTFVGCRVAQRPMPNQPDTLRTPGAPARYGTPGTPTTPGKIGTPGAPGTALDRLGTPGAPDTPYAPGRVGINNNAPAATDANRTAQYIANQLSAMEPIERATVVISGNTALVGIDIVDNYYKYDEEEYLKDDLVQKVKNMAPGVTNVAITESPDLYQRISNLSRDMANGRVIQGLTNEFTEIVNRIRPSVR
ncbi:MAG: hypothetical protein PWR27_621 [Petroclostridium sp.]|nr:sporulation lipoprotein YhcN/YlaJ family [Clostridia bacterium]MDK2809912.1 hypothetical protein [Petroclostridium sp.]